MYGSGKAVIESGDSLQISQASSAGQDIQKPQSILDELMTVKPEHARAIAAERLQNVEPSPPAKGFLPKINGILFSKKIKKEQRTEKLAKQIKNANLILQHRAFLAGKEWDEIKSDVTAQLKTEFTTDFSNASSSPYFREKNDTSGVENRDLVYRLVDDVAKHQLYHGEYTFSPGGARFKAWKNQPDQRRLDATQVRTNNGNVYALINSPTDEQHNEIKRQCGLDVNQKGSLSRYVNTKVRCAQNLFSGDFVAVKKFKNRNNNMKPLINEINGYHLASKATSQSRHMQYLDAAIAQIESRRGIQKGYLFTPLMNQGDGDKAAKRIAELRSVFSEQAQAKLLYFAKEYAGAVADLHADSIYNGDIKPANFLHHVKIDQESGKATGDEIIQLFDPELMGDKLGELRGVSPRFAPPEVLDYSGFIPGEDYSRDKHDAFSLGITLLYLKHGCHVDGIDAAHLCLSDGKSITLSPRTLSQNKGYACWGIKDEELSRKLHPLNTLDNIIAHLLNQNVKNRISAAEAYKALDELYKGMGSNSSPKA